MNYILSNREGLRVAVVVNDMGEINVDADLIRGGASLSSVKDEMVSAVVCFCVTALIKVSSCMWQGWLAPRGGCVLDLRGEHGW